MTTTCNAMRKSMLNTYKIKGINFLMLGTLFMKWRVILPDQRIIVANWIQAGKRQKGSQKPNRLTKYEYVIRTTKPWFDVVAFAENRGL